METLNCEMSAASLLSQVEFEITNKSAGPFRWIFLLGRKCGSGSQFLGVWILRDAQEILGTDLYSVVVKKFYGDVFFST